MDEVSELCRCNWEEVFRMGAVEFLNLICYKRDKVEKQRQDLEKWKRTH